VGMDMHLVQTILLYVCPGKQILPSSSTSIDLCILP
jgi:hypothetical protein